MSGTAKVKPPKNDAEWARGMQRRVEQVEHPSSTRIGPWVLSSEQESGDLIASHVNGGAVKLAQKPEGEGEADAVSSGWSHIKVSRQTPQTMSRGTHTPVAWDSVDSQSSDWSATPGSTTFVIPQNGVWLINYRLYFGALADVLVESFVIIDGSPRSANRTVSASAEPMLSCTEVFTLNEGAEIVCTAGKAGSGTFTIGPYVGGSAMTSLSLTRLPIG